MSVCEQRKVPNSKVRCQHSLHLTLKRRKIPPLKKNEVNIFRQWDIFHLKYFAFFIVCDDEPGVKIAVVLLRKLVSKYNACTNISYWSKRGRKCGRVEFLSHPLIMECCKKKRHHNVRKWFASKCDHCNRVFTVSGSMMGVCLYFERTVCIYLVLFSVVL